MTSTLTGFAPDEYCTRTRVRCGSALSAPLSHLEHRLGSAFPPAEQEPCPAELQVERELRSCAGWPRRLEKSRVRRLVPSGPEFQPPASDLEAGAQQLREWSRAAHACAEAGVIVFA